MLNKKLIIFYSCFFSIFIFCTKINSTEKNLSMEINKKQVIQFKKWTVENQVNYINKLDVKSKIKFLKFFLPGSEFISPPNEELLFLENGEVLVFSYNSGNTMKKAFWKVDDTSLIIWKKEKYIQFPRKMKEVWSDMNAMSSSGSDKQLGLRLLPKTKTYSKALIFYNKVPSGVFRNFKK